MVLVGCLLLVLKRKLFVLKALVKFMISHKLEPTFPENDVILSQDHPRKLESGRRVWCFEQHVLSHGAGPTASLYGFQRLRLLGSLAKNKL